MVVMWYDVTRSAGLARPAPPAWRSRHRATNVGGRARTYPFALATTVGVAGRRRISLTCEPAYRSLCPPPSGATAVVVNTALPHAPVRLELLGGKSDRPVRRRCVSPFFIHAYRRRLVRFIRGIQVTNGSGLEIMSVKQAVVRSAVFSWYALLATAWRRRKL